MLGVIDNGVGMTPELIEHVFDMFVRGGDSRSAAPGGLGIGLTLVKVLVEMHGGRVEVASDGPGRGSTFTIRLPWAGRRASLERAPESAPAPAVARKILIVEDNDDARRLLVEALQLKGHDIRSAADGPAALEIVEAWRPDVVILDIGLPGMSGHDVAQRLKQRPDLQNVLLVAVTGWGQAHDRRRSAAAGIAHHLTKPVDPDRLDQLIGVMTRP
jgi:CheY-like chemotaxis protein